MRSFHSPGLSVINLQRLLACLNFTFRRFILTSMNYGSSTSSKKLLRWVRLDLILTMRDINSNLNPITKFTSISRNAEFKNILPWNYLNQHKNHSIHHENRHRLCDKTRHPIVSLMESWRKLRQQHDQNFPMEGKPL